MSVPPRRARSAPAMALGLALASSILGCDQPTGGSPRLRPKAKPPEEVAEAPAEAPRIPILGKTTQDIRDPEAAKKAGGVAIQPRIKTKDPILLVGNAYVSIIGQAATLNIQHTVDLYQATNGEYPKTTEEFMEKIIKANNIALPKLPHYQEYSYDAANHKLVIYEYEDRK